MTSPDDRGPAAYPPPPRVGLLSPVGDLLRLPVDLLRAVVAAVRLPPDLVILVGYLVREAPSELQDVRFLVDDVARLEHHGEGEGALRELIDELARPARAEGAGAPAHVLRSPRDLAAVQAALERRRLQEGAVGTRGG